VARSAADTLLALVQRCNAEGVYSFLVDVAVRNTTLADEGLEGADRDGVVARAGFNLGIATAHRMMTAIGGAR